MGVCNVRGIYTLFDGLIAGQREGWVTQLRKGTRGGGGGGGSVCLAGREEGWNEIAGRGGRPGGI